MAVEDAGDVLIGASLVISKYTRDLGINAFLLGVIPYQAIIQFNKAAEAYEAADQLRHSSTE